MIRRCNLLDATLLYQLITDDEAAAVATWKLKSRVNYFLTNTEENILVVYEYVSGDKYQVHIYSLEAARGKGLLSFIRETAHWMLKNTEINVALCFVKRGDLHVRILASGLLGAESKGFVGNELLYVFTREGVRGWKN
jgi:hypothetical protein